MKNEGTPSFFTGELLEKTVALRRGAGGPQQFLGSGDRFRLSIANWCLASGFGDTANNELSRGSMYFLPDCFRPPGRFPFVLNAGFVDNASA